MSGRTNEPNASTGAAASPHESPPPVGADRPAVVVERPTVVSGRRVTTSPSGVSDAEARAVHDLVTACAGRSTTTVFRRVPPLAEWLAAATSPTHYLAIGWDGDTPVAAFGLETDLRRSTMLDPLRSATGTSARPDFATTVVAVHPDHKPSGALEEVTLAAAAFAGEHGARLLVGAPAHDVDTGFVELLALVLRDQLVRPVVEVDSWRVFAVDLRRP